MSIPNMEPSDKCPLHRFVCTLVFERWVAYDDIVVPPNAGYMKYRSRRIFKLSKKTSCPTGEDLGLNENRCFCVFNQQMGHTLIIPFESTMHCPRMKEHFTAKHFLTFKVELQTSFIFVEQDAIDPI